MKGVNLSVIEVSHLSKNYGNIQAVSDLSFTVEPGKIYGFLGPNGAGKSTTLNMITGCLSSDSGEVKVNGYDIFDDAAKAKKAIGYSPELPPVYGDMTPYEYLTFVAKAKGMARADIPAHLQEIMQATGIVEMRNRLIRNLSKGYRQRVDIAQALVGWPEIVIFDEPTVGLDPKQIIEIRDLIRSLGDKHTVLLSSHILSEVEAVCDEILIISHGKLVACDTPQNLESRFTSNRVINVLVHGDRETVAKAVAEVPSLTVLSCQLEAAGMTRLTLEAAGKEELRAKLFYALAAADCPILEMTQTHSSLEDVFLELTAAADPVDEAALAAAQTKSEGDEQ